MILYSDANFASPYAFSAYVALREKGIDFELRTIKLENGEHKSEEFFDQSLTSRVPTLIDDDFSLSESSAISEYLEDIKPEPNLYPEEIRERNRARQLQAWLRSDLLALRIERPTEVIFFKPSDQELSLEGKLASQKLFKVATALLSENSMNIFGSWSIADVDLSLMINRLVANGDEVPEALVRYVQHQWQHPAIKDWVSLKRQNL